MCRYNLFYLKLMQTVYVSIQVLSHQTVLERRQFPVTVLLMWCYSRRSSASHSTSLCFFTGHFTSRFVCALPWITNIISSLKVHSGTSTSSHSNEHLAVSTFVLACITTRQIFVFKEGPWIIANLQIFIYLFIFLKASFLNEFKRKSIEVPND